MWLELFLLDNAVMNALILRAAAAMCSSKIPFWRMLAFSFGGALYAAVAFSYPVMGLLPFKLITGLSMALALPFKTARAYITHTLCLFFAAFLTGGLCICLALAMGGGVKNGFLLASVPLRAVLVGALAASFLPRALRGVLARNLKNTLSVQLKLCHGEKEYLLDGIVDTGNFLTEPLSALPVVLFYAEGFPPCGGLPLPARGAAGNETVLYAFTPDALIDCATGARIHALVALAPAPMKCGGALVPPTALSSLHTKENI